MPGNDDMILVHGRCIYTWWEILPGRLVLVGLLSALTLGWAAVTAGQTDSSDPASGNTGRALAKASFGFKAGISFAQHCGTEEREPDYTVASHWRTGFAVGAFLYFPVTQRFGLQQEFAYVQKGSRQDIGVEILEIPTILDVSYEMDYIEIQALLRFAWLQWGYSELYSLSGTALCLKVRDRYTLTGQVSDGTETVPLHADSDMSEVDMFDFALIYGTGFEFSMLGRNLLIEYRFTMSWNTLAMPTYAYVPFGEEEILIDNEPVPLKNQNHLILFGVRF
jgi:hypothetical protein